MRIKTRLKETPKNLWIFIALGLLFAFVPEVSAHDFWIDQKGKEFLPGIELSEHRPGLEGGRRPNGYGRKRSLPIAWFSLRFPQAPECQSWTIDKDSYLQELKRAESTTGLRGARKI